MGNNHKANGPAAKEQAATSNNKGFDNLDELLKKISDASSPYNTDYSFPGREEIDNAWQASYYDLRKNWSWWVLWALWIMIVYQFWLTYKILSLIEWKVVEFDSVGKLFYLLAGENFAQIVGAAILVVKFLFPAASEKKKK